MPLLTGAGGARTSYSSGAQTSSQDHSRFRAAEQVRPSRCNSASPRVTRLDAFHSVRLSGQDRVQAALRLVTSNRRPGWSDPRRTRRRDRSLVSPTRRMSASCAAAHSAGAAGPGSAVPAVIMPSPSTSASTRPTVARADRPANSCTSAALAQSRMRVPSGSDPTWQASRVGRPSAAPAAAMSRPDPPSTGSRCRPRVPPGRRTTAAVPTAASTGPGRSRPRGAGVFITPAGRRLGTPARCQRSGRVWCAARPVPGAPRQCSRREVAHPMVRRRRPGPRGRRRS